MGPACGRMITRNNTARRIKNCDDLIPFITGVDKETIGDNYTFTINTVDGYVRICSKGILSSKAWTREFLKIGYVVTFKDDDIAEMMMFMMGQVAI